MRTIVFALALTAAAGAGCAKSNSDKPAPASDNAPAVKADKPTIATVTPDQLDQAIAKGDCQAVDANGDGTRKQMGVVPGAVLLTSSMDYKLSELPSDKSKGLVFYCANTSCGASHMAADRALEAGYVNVKVMPQGIAGWVSSGKKVQTI